MISTRNTIDMIDPELKKALDSLGRWALIGGAIRNALIGIPPRDFDVMVWASPERIFDVISQFDDARFRAYPSRQRFAASEFPSELKSADLGVQLRNTDVWSAMYPRWSGLPSDWNCLDFTINAGGMWKGPQGWEVRGAEEHYNWQESVSSMPDLSGMEKWQFGAFRSGMILAEKGDEDLANRVREYQAREEASFIAGYESCGADNFANGVPLDSEQTKEFLSSLSPRNAQAYRDGYESARAKHGDLSVTAVVDVNKLHAAIQSLLGNGQKFDDARVLEAINSCVLP